MTPPGSVNATDQAKLNDYLDNGGNLYVESVNLGIDHNSTPFFNRLGIKYSYDGDDYEVDDLIPQNGNFMENVSYQYRGGDDPHYSVDRLVSSGATLLYQSQDGFNRMYSYDNGIYRTVSSSVVFGALKNGDSLNIQTYMMAEIVNYLLGITTITDLQELFSGKDNSVTVYPNPTASFATLSLMLNQPSYVKTVVYNDNGMLIKNLFEGTLPTGNQQITWNGYDEYGNLAGNGLYFVVLTIGNQRYTEKLLLMR